MLFRSELTRDLGTTRPRNDVRAELCHLPFGELRETLVERSGDGELENRVAEKLQTLI